MPDVSDRSNSAHPKYQALIQLLRTAEDLWNASRTFFAHWDLGPSQFNILNLLAGHAEGLSQSELSRLLIMHRSNATGLVDRLERRHLVRRLEDPTDRRAYRVVLTPAGNELLERIHPSYFDAAEAVWTDIPSSRVQALLEDLRSLATAATRIAADTAPATDSNPNADTRQDSITEQADRSPPRRLRSLRQGRSRRKARAGTVSDPLRTSDL